MIEKLKMISVEEQKKALDSEFGFPLFDGAPLNPMAPSAEELMNKINEIIDYINEKENCTSNFTKEVKNE